MTTHSDEDVLDWLRREYAVPFSGWDFSYIHDRRITVRSAAKPWSYDDLCIEGMGSAESVLDIDTGGGERFAGFLAAVGRPVRAKATEGWPPNLPIARERLRAFGVDVIEAERGALPLPDASIDLIINRHGLFEPADYARLLRLGGRVISQQVGSDTNGELVAALAGEPGVNRELSSAVMASGRGWDAAAAAALCSSSGLTVEQALEDRHVSRFLDAGAVTWYLKAVPWTVEGFSIDSHAEQLLDLHRRIDRDGYFDTTFHEFLIVARRPTA
jgi:ubiquinone/menaquinone biosynthesis C-methylase UbiE